MFLDHYKPAYTTDLKLCEELGLVIPGTVLAADNVIKPGNPPYLEYVRANVAQKRKKAEHGAKGGSVKGFKEGNIKQYAKRYGAEVFSQSAGNPNLVYHSKLIHSYEPTGVPVNATNSSLGEIH
jgi:catechol O-methyltransferase